MKTPIKTILTAPAEGGRQFSLRVAPKFAVDRATGQLRDIALLTAGVEAEGWGMFVDQRTIETAAECVAERGKLLKGALRHMSWDEYMASNGDRMGMIPGFFAGVAVRGEQLVAASFQFYDAFKKANEDAVASLLEMAEKTPLLFGVSIEAYGYLVYVDTEGNEFSAMPEDRELLYNGLPALRITKLTYAAFVDEPAANPGGVFAALARKVKSLFGAGGATGDDRARLATVIDDIAAFLKQGGLPARADSNGPADSAHSTTEDQTMKVIAQIQTKFSADKAKLAAAFALLAEKPESTIEQIETALAAQKPAELAAPKPLEMSAVVAKFGADKGRLARAFSFLADKPESTIEQIEAHLAAADAAELKRLREENTKLAADKAAAEQKAATLAAAGRQAPVDLGAASSAGPRTDGQKELTGRARVAAAFATQLAHQAGAN